MLAERARLSVESIGALERGTRTTPYRATLVLLAEALALDASARAELEAAATRARRLRPEHSPGSTREGNVPRFLTAMFGRERELHELLGLVGEHRLITLVGPGGVGKTRLASELALRAVAGFADGVGFVDLAPLAAGAAVGPQIAAVVGARESAGTPLIDTLVAALHAKTMLLVLDNCEHVLAPVAHAVEALLERTPNVRVLATSRERLRIGPERVIDVAPLSISGFADDPSIDVAHSPSVRLFVDRAEALGRRTPSDDQEAIVTIVRRLDGMPLAIELAAALTRTLSPTQIAASLDQRFAVLTSGSRTALPRHQTLRAMFDWGFELLSAEQQAVLRRCAIFSGTWSLDAARAVCSDDAIVPEQRVVATIATLVDKSIVATFEAGGERRYRYHETTRAYARERLDASGETEAVAARLAAFVDALATQAAREVDTLGEAAWIARYTPELDNVRSALGWALREGGNVLCARSILGALGGTWTTLEAPVEGLRWLDEALAAVGDRAGEPASAPLWLAVSILCGTLYLPVRQEEAGRRALSLYAALEDELGIAHARRVLASALMRLRRFDESRALLEAALATYRARDLRAMAMRAQSGLGSTEMFAERMDAARRSFEEARTLALELGKDRYYLSISLNLAEATYISGDAPQAFALASETLDVARELGSNEHVTNLLANLAAYANGMDRPDLACDALREVLPALRASGEFVLLISAFQHAALVAALRGDCERAAPLVGYIDAEMERVGAIRDPPERSERERLAAMLSETLGPRAALALGAGRKLGFDRAFDEAMGICGSETRSPDLGA